jgi:hypothetical protein
MALVSMPKIAGAQTTAPSWLHTIPTLGPPHRVKFVLVPLPNALHVRQTA